MRGKLWAWMSEELAAGGGVCAQVTTAVLALLPWETVLSARVGGTGLDPSSWGG